MSMDLDTARGRRTAIERSLEEYGRGFAGGLLFSLPLLYTMEMWWTGFVAGPFRLLALLGATFVLLLGYNRFAGMRHDAGWTEVAIDSVEELGLGIATSTVLLFLIGQIGPGLALHESLGKVVVEAAVVAIGFSVGTAQLGTGDTGHTGTDEPEARGAHRFRGEMTVAFCGAMLFAANVAPTEEIMVIADVSGPFRLLGLAVLSLALASIILHFSNFRRTARLRWRENQTTIVSGTVTTYAVALVASALYLWFFGRFEGVSLHVAVSLLVVLGLPATLGASAGKLLITSS